MQPLTQPHQSESLLFHRNCWCRATGAHAQHGIALDRKPNGWRGLHLYEINHASRPGRLARDHQVADWNI